MPTNASTVVTYGDVSRREDLLDIITNITPQETQLLNGLPKSKATNTIHEFLTDTLDTAGDNANIEGNDVTPGTLTTPSRVVNFTQIVQKSYQVSDTQRAVNHAGFSDLLSYEIQKAMKSWANDVEYALMNGSGVSGNASVARRMKGVIAFISTNATAHTSGSNTLNEPLFNDALQDAWTQGGNPTEVYTTAALKRRLSSFTSNNTRFQNIDDKRLTNTVDVYESDFGIVKLFKHRYIASGSLVAIQPDKWAIAYLRNPQTYELGKTGSSAKGFIEGELTLEGRQEAANSKRTGLV